MIKFGELKDGITYPLYFAYCGRVYNKTCKVFRRDNNFIDIYVFNSKGDREYIWAGEGWYLRIRDFESRNCEDYFLNIEDAYMSIMNNIKKQKNELNQKLLKLQTRLKKALDERKTI